MHKNSTELPSVINIGIKIIKLSTILHTNNNQNDDNNIVSQTQKKKAGWRLTGTLYLCIFLLL